MQNNIQSGGRHFHIHGDVPFLLFLLTSMKKTSQVCQNWEISYWTGIPHFTALHFCGLHKYCVVFVCLFFVVLGFFWCFFKKIVHLWPPCIEEVYWCHIPTSFAHFVSRFGNSHNISNLILLFCYGDL